MLTIVDRSELNEDAPYVQMGDMTAYVQSGGFLLTDDQVTDTFIFVSVLTLTDNNFSRDGQYHQFMKCNDSGLRLTKETYDALTQYYIKWSRYPNTAYGANYEVSSRGDRNYSAFGAYLPNGNNIETAYQLDVKGYREMSDDWRAGKGRPPLRDITPKKLFEEYSMLWIKYFTYKPEKLAALCNIINREGITHLTDMFASSPINQARALAYIINMEVYNDIHLGVGTA